jgi:hypothetical protein
MVSIDATHIAATAAWPGGFFASYHVYPYYPDFLRLEYAGPDPYASYLAALRAYHGDQALMVTEFGVPTSLGMAHLGPAGRNQGGESEKQAGRIDAGILGDIKREGFAGGVAFEWIDEWFKFTWNTLPYELPGDRRQLWRNPLTNEEHFGLVAAEPGKPTASRQIAPGVRASSDTEYVYLRLSNVPRAGATIGFDVRPGTNKGLPGKPGVYPKADVAVTVGPGHKASLVQSAWTDPNSFLYGAYVKVDPATLEPGSGVWISPWQLLDRPYTVPSTGEQHPTERVDIGMLRWGPSRADDRNLVDGRGSTVELRVPWSMLGFSDPSSHRVLVPHAGGTLTTQRVGKLGIAIASGRKLVTTRGYAWRDWNSVRWQERRKAGFGTVAKAFASAAR